MKTGTKVLFFFCYIIPLFSHGQFQHYSYQRELLGVADMWHKLTLPDDIYDKVKPALSDLRIIAIPASGDTTEVPYILKSDAGHTIEKDVEFSIVNKSQHGRDFYITLALHSVIRINQIMLDIENDNFDWRIDLGGSQDQKQWFVIANDYRILSIKNTETNYSFTKVDFPDSEYAFYRIRFKEIDTPAFKSARLKLREVEDGRLVGRLVKSFKIHEEKETEKTVIDLNLIHNVPVSEIKIQVSDEIDYYRPISIEYLRDSFETEKGWRYNYQSLFAGTLSSFEKASFRFPVAMAKTYRISIRNSDNNPLHISDVEASGYNYDLFMRFADRGKYFFLYGNEDAYRPDYDLRHFEENIPETIMSVTLGEERKIIPILLPDKEPLFMNQYWLWIIISVVGVVLVFFTIRMMKSN